MKPAPLLAVVFVRAPRPGRVKTRLARDLGDEAAWRLYRAFALDVLAAVAASGINTAVACHPPEDVAMTAAWLGPDWTVRPQAGADLGQRLHQAFAMAFAAGAGHVLILGSDIPALTPAHLLQAESALREHRAVIGPAPDGGFWCLGLSRDTLSPEIFSGVAWGGPTVLGQTLANLRKTGIEPAQAVSLADVDNVGDLRHLAEAIAAGNATAIHTASILGELGLIPKKRS